MSDKAPLRYKPVGYDCGMEAAHEGNWITIADHTAEVAKLRAERDEARDWLAKANNEFGSQTWSWPNLWQRIAQLKELSNERWKRAVSAEAELAALRKAADALAMNLEAWEVIAHHCTISDGVCCCGEDMKKHSDPMYCGHAPVDHGGYQASLHMKEAEAALAAYRATKEGT